MPEALQALSGVSHGSGYPAGGTDSSSANSVLVDDYQHRRESYAQLPTPYTQDDGWVGNDYLFQFGPNNVRYTLEALGDPDLADELMTRRAELAARRGAATRAPPRRQWTRDDFLLYGSALVFVAALFVNARINGA